MVKTIEEPLVVITSNLTCINLISNIDYIIIIIIIIIINIIIITIIIDIKNYVFISFQQIPFFSLIMRLVVNDDGDCDGYLTSCE